jgi:hypothetical protein
MGQRWIETKTLLDAQEVGGGTAKYTSAINAFNMVPEYAGLYLSLGNVTSVMTITQQGSLDNEFWQDITNSTSVKLGTNATILCGVTNASRAYIAFTPLTAPYLRLKLESVVTVPTCTVKVVFAGDKA